MRALPYALGALFILAIALLVWALSNDHDAFMSECLPRSTPLQCQEEWRVREGKP